MTNLWNGQVRVEVCPNAEWKGAPFMNAPLKIDDFDVTSDDFDYAAYGENVIRKNGITLSFLIIACILLLLFLLWRLLRWCCVTCCCVSSCDERRRKNSDILWTKRSALLKIAILVTSLAVISMAAFSSSNLEVNFAKGAWNVIHSVKTAIQGILDIGDVVVGELDAMFESLHHAENIFISDVNVTYLQTNMECIVEFLEEMPDPAVLRSSIASLETLLGVTLLGELASFRSRLTTLEEAVSNDLHDHVRTVVQMENSLINFGSELRAVDEAIDALEPDNSMTSDPFVRSLETASYNMRDINEFVTQFTDFKTALQEIASIDFTTLISDIEISMTALPALITTARDDSLDVETQFEAFRDDYNAAVPCITGFVSRIETIAADIITLPQNALDNVQALDDVTSPLETFMTGDATGNLMESLHDITDQIDTPETDNLEHQLTVLRVNLETIVGNSTELSSDIDAFITILTSFETSVSNLQTLIDTYLLTSTSGDYMDMLDYARITFASELAAILDGVDSLIVDLANTFDSAESVVAMEDSLLSDFEAQASEVASMESLIVLPNLTLTLSALDATSDGYTSLGTSPSQVFADVETLLTDIETLMDETISDVTSKLSSVSDDARDALEEARDDSVEEIVEFEMETRNLTVGHFLNQPEDLGLALLAEDVNDKLYLVTLCFYCATIALCLVLVTTVMINCQFGVAASLLLYLVLLVMYFIVALLSSTVLIVENDLCANLEEIILKENVDVNLDRLLRYYFIQRGSVRDVLIEAFGLDLEDLETEAAHSAHEAETIIDDWGTKGNLTIALNGAVDGVGSILDSANDLEEMFGYSNIHPLYKEIKSFFCCDISAFLLTIWTDLMATGGLSLSVVFLGFLALHNLDKMPRADCCGCSCRRRYLDDILADEDFESDSSSKKTPSAGPSRKGTQIGTEIV